MKNLKFTEKRLHATLDTPTVPQAGKTFNSCVEVPNYLVSKFEAKSLSSYTHQTSLTLSIYHKAVLYEH